MEVINKWLSSQGTNLYGDPIFRLVWSEDQLERRFGTFVDYYEDIFIREVSEIRTVKKYLFINERWILEKWAPPELTYSEELPDSNRGDYIPFFVFEDSKGNYLNPTLKVVEFLVNYANGKIKKEKVKSKEELFDAEVLMFMDMLDTSPIQNALHMKEAIGYGK